MRRTVLALLLVLSAPLFAERRISFGIESFLAVAPTGKVVSTVFSPFAFELDCVALSELFDPIRRAAMAETIGVMTGWDSVYPLMSERYVDGRTNGVDFVTARALLVPTHRVVSPAFRARMQQDWGLAVCPLRSGRAGAESWLKASMEGRMEDFSLDDGESDPKAVSFRDLTSLHCSWSRPFPQEYAEELAFDAPSGRRSLPALRDVRPGGVWETKTFSLLRLPMTDGAYFYAVKPAEGRSVTSLWRLFTPDSFGTVLVAVDSVTETGVFRGDLEVVMPRLDAMADVDLLPALSHFRIVTDGLVPVAVSGGLRSFRQRMRFTLDGRGALATADGQRAVPRLSSSKPRRFALDRPFVYFIHHKPTHSIPVVGVYVGEGGK